MKKKMESLYVDVETFKKLKKNRNFILFQNINNIEKIKKNKKILIIDEKSKKKTVRKVKKIYFDVTPIDFKKKKCIVPQNINSILENDKNLCAIEFKMKLNLIVKFLLILLILILLFISYNYFKTLVSQKVIADVIEYKQEEEVVVFIDINPSIALKVKNETVVEAICLDKDCNDLLEKMQYNYDDNINNQKLAKVLDDFYEGAKKFGYDVSNGINVSSSSSGVEALVYDIKDVKYNHISVIEEENILNENNVKFEITSLSKEEYNKQLLDKLKNDPDYGKSYTCDIYDNEVKCYMIDFMSEIMDEFGKESLIGKLAELDAVYFKFKNLLDKFDFEYTLDDDKSIIGVKLGNGKNFDYADKYVSVVSNSNNEIITTIDITNCLTYHIYNLGNNNEVLEDKMYYLPFAKVDLLTKTYDNKDIIFVDRTYEPIVLYGIQ